MVGTWNDPTNCSGQSNPPFCSAVSQCQNCGIGSPSVCAAPETCAICPQDCCPTCYNGVPDAAYRCDVPANCASCSGCAPCCGNNVREGTGPTGELCDGTDISEDCADLGLGTGPLTCAADCTYVTDQCDTCGNGQFDPGEEECEPGINDSQTCEDLMGFGFDHGTPVCQTSGPNRCTYDTSDCSNCGNRNVEGSEQCDDGNFVDSDGCTNDCRNCTYSGLVPVNPQVCGGQCGSVGSFFQCSNSTVCHHRNTVNPPGCVPDEWACRQATGWEYCTKCGVPTMSSTDTTPRIRCDRRWCSPFAPFPCSEETNSTCPNDCYCDNGTCDVQSGETTANCPEDCGTACPDTACNGNEDCQSCATDCGACCTCTAWTDSNTFFQVCGMGQACGFENCESTQRCATRTCTGPWCLQGPGQPHNTLECQTDPRCSRCGDGVPNNGETPATCCQDTGGCP